MDSKSQSGFSYIEVMIAIIILVVGILGMLQAISASVLMTSRQKQQLKAKQIATSTMESIMSVKETSAKTAATVRLGWISVGNVNSNPDDTGVPQGVFSNGQRPVVEGAGLDNIIGTDDDAGPPVTGYTREIVITDQCDLDRPSRNCPTPGTFPVRARTVEVTIRFPFGQTMQQEKLTTVLTDYEVRN